MTSAETLPIIPSAVEKHAKLSQVVQGLSHDLSANFALLQDSFESLKRQCERQRRSGLTDNTAHVDACLRQSKRLLDDLRSATRTGSIEMQPERVEVSDVVREIAYEQRELIFGQGARVEIAQGLPAVMCHRTRVHQIFTNLIRNAANHGCRGGNGRIRIAPREKLSNSSQWVTIAVEDEGPGIPPESHEEVFLAGRRLPATHEDGSGMGLTLVQQLVEHYGGSVNVDSEYTAGAAFLVRLPAAGLKNRVGRKASKATAV